MNQRLTILLRIGFVLLDLIVLNLVFIICRFIFRSNISPDVEILYSYLWFFSNVAWTAVSWGSNVYHERYIYSFEKFSRQTMSAFFYFLGVVLLYLFFTKEGNISRLFLISILTSFAVSLMINRFLHLALYNYFQSKNHIVRKVMIIGYNDRAKKLAEYLEQEPIKTEIVGFCEEEANISELSNYPIIGGINEVVETSKQFKVTEIYS